MIDYCIGEKYDKYSIRNWIIEKIAKQTKPSDIIILPFLDFGICVELIRVEAFFESELDEKISQHIGLDIGYINLSQQILHYFSDEEYFVFEYYERL